VSRDGLSLATGVGSSIEIADLESGAVRQTLSGHSVASFFGVTISADWRSLVASDREVSYLWDLTTGSPPSRLGGTVSFNQAAIAGAIVVTAGQVWDRATGKLLRTLAGQGGITAFAASPDGSRIATATRDGEVQIWDTATGRSLALLQGPASAVEHVAFSPDRSYVVSASHDGMITLWNAGGELLHSLRAADGERLERLAVSPDGSFVVTSTPSAVRIWDPRSGSGRSLEALERSVNAMALSPDGRFLGVITQSMVGLWSVSSGHLYASLGPNAQAIAFSQDGRLVATLGLDGLIRLWNTAGGSPLRSLMSTAATLTAVALSPTGAVVAGLRWDGSIVLWDAATGRELASLYIFEPGDWAVIAPDGRWDAARDGESRWVTVWQKGVPGSLAMHPDRHVVGLLSTVLEGYRDKTIGSR
jgi:WD40 repeat protein